VIEIIPSINHADAAEMRRRIRLVEPHVSWVHVDVSDGIFSSVKVFNEPEALYGFETKANIELHLMIDKPEDHLGEWLKTGAKRFLVHIESTADFCGVWERLNSAGVETGFAMKPETPIESYEPHYEWVKYVLILGVAPGPSGQLMQPNIIEKIALLRQKFPEAKIEVDGGVSLALGTAKKAADAGANALCSGYEIFSSDNALDVLEKFKNCANK
jgi:ribulose-phosphate 3-epimerase